MRDYMNSVDSIESGKPITVEDLAKEIGEELEASCMGGVLEDQLASVVVMSKDNSSIWLQFVNGQKFVINVSAV